MPENHCGRGILLVLLAVPATLVGLFQESSPLVRADTVAEFVAKRKAVLLGLVLFAVAGALWAGAFVSLSRSWGDAVTAPGPRWGLGSPGGGR